MRPLGSPRSGDEGGGHRRRGKQRRALGRLWRGDSPISRHPWLFFEWLNDGRWRRWQLTLPDRPSMIDVLAIHTLVLSQSRLDGIEARPIHTGRMLFVRRPPT